MGIAMDSTATETDFEKLFKKAVLEKLTEHGKCQKEMLPLVFDMSFIRFSKMLNELGQETPSLKLKEESERFRRWFLEALKEQGINTEGIKL